MFKFFFGVKKQRIRKTACNHYTDSWNHFTESAIADLIQKYSEGL